MSEYARQIYEAVMQGVAGIGGIGAVIAIVTTIIKTFGGNSVKTKLAAHKVELGTLLDDGLTKIQDKINTDITVDISSQVNTTVERQTKELRESVNYLKDEINTMRKGLATIIDCEIERRNRLKQNADDIIEKAAELRDIKPVEHETKAKVHISIASDNALTTQENEPGEKEDEKPVINKVVI